MTQVGTGKYTYELIPNYPKLPAGGSFGNASRIGIDSQDRFYVFQRQHKIPVMIFDREGNFLSSWGVDAIADAHGMRIVNDIVYTTDRSDCVAVIFTLDGKPLQVIGKRGVPSDTGYNHKPPHLVERAAGPFNYPTDLVPAPSGDLYATDGYGNCRVHRFTKDGKLISSWGKPGKKAPGEFHLPHSVIIVDGKVYVCDRSNRRVQIFTLEGEFINMWTGMGPPCDIWRDENGIFYICELEADGQPTFVSIRDDQGKVITRWQCRHAHGISVDSHGDIYLALPKDKGVDKYVLKH